MKFINTDKMKNININQGSFSIDNLNNPEQDKKLKIITLSGTESVTKNMTIYEYGDDIIAVDCGIGYPDSEMLGVDVVIPDMTYLVENAHRFKGLFITHGHEDHIGAIPYLLKQVNVPIYGNKLVQGFIGERLKEKRFSGIGENISFHLLTSEGEEVTVGSFTVSGFRVNHSVPSSMGLAIKTPVGMVLHMADYKIDWTPVLDKPIDLAKIAEFGEKGVLCLLSDCLGATTDGYSKSETSLSSTFHELFEQASDRQIMVTTISSNISRIYQITDAALKMERKVALSGRSIDQSVRVARGLGYLPFPDDAFITDEDAMRYLQKDLVYIIAGCYGQQGSALDRVARGEHSNIVLEQDSLVVFSADPNPPGVEEDVERLMDQLTLRGAEVIYSKIQENLHVSGHGPKGDLTTIASIVRPKYFIPIGGTVTKARAYRDLVSKLGFDKNSVFELLEGESVEFSDGHAKRGERLTLKQILIDGSSVAGIGPMVIKDREQLSTDGVFVVVVPMRGGVILRDKIEVITRGFIYVRESKELMNRSKDVIGRIIDKMNGNQINQDNGGKKNRKKDKQKKDQGSDLVEINAVNGDITTDVVFKHDWGAVKGKIEKDVGRFLYKETGRNPMVIVHGMDV